MTYSNDILRRVMDISEELNRKDILFHEKITRRTENVNSIINDVRLLQEALLTFWNIERYKFDKMCHLAKQIDVFQLLVIDTLGGAGYSIEHDNTLVLNFDKIKTITFLSNMSNLHKYTHGKVYHMKKSLSDNAASLIIELVDNTFIHVMQANSKVPKTQSEYIERKRHISEAIKALNELNRPLLMCFDVMNYSENTLKEWGNLINTEIKLLIGLQKSDKERFGDLTN